VGVGLGAEGARAQLRPVWSETLPAWTKNISCVVLHQAFCLAGAALRAGLGGPRAGGPSPPARQLSCRASRRSGGWLGSGVRARRLAAFAGFAPAQAGLVWASPSRAREGAPGQGARVW